jgi:DNA polymerase III alpha subunit (gram-positive type)
MMSKLLFLDIETTGFSRQWNEIIEIAAIVVDSETGRDFDRNVWVDGKLMHFYNCLEQLTHAHEKEEAIKYNERMKEAFQEFAKTANEITGGF